MAGENKPTRLGKAASEFNVSKDAIVELLQSKGITIENSPNTKLSPEMYEILLQKFSGEKQVKEEASKINMDYSYGKPKVEESAPAAQPVEEEPAREILIKQVNVIEKEPVQNIEIEIPKPKVVGKIDLEEPKKTKKTAAKKEETPEVTETEEKPAKKTTKKKSPEHIDTVVEKVDVKIIDKIDLDELEGKTKAKGKKKSTATQEEPVQEEQLVEEQEPVVEAEEPVVEETPAAPEHVVEHIKTDVQKLEGPKILGKIALEELKPAKKEPAPDAAGEDAKKKKRKRIKHPANTKPLDKKDEGHRKKPEVQKAEISEEDIERQLKETLQRMGPLGKSKTSKHRREKRQHIHAEIMEHELQEREEQKKLKVTEFITANELATMLNVPVTQIISTCMSIGLFVSINQRLDAETIALLAEEYGFQIEFVGVDTEEELKAHDVDDPKDLQPRHPIVTVMGHVDHGKTSLLDYIRKSNVIAGEAGGITQHIGAYEVTLPDGRKITFLDTPGHEAFTAMRARGAKITDLCIIVIAADDAIMPQTVEAINHAQAAGVPMVFAISKIDKPNANPDKIREGLANMNILVEEWGGKYQCQEIDAKHGVNVNELLEKVLLEAEMLDLKANPNRPGVGTVIESSLDKGKGYVAKILIQNGTLRVGDPILAGCHFGKVKALFNERNQNVTSVGPASPVLLLGLNGAPQAGDTFRVCPSEQEAREAATKRSQLVREMGLRTQKHINLDEIGRRLAIGDFKELNIIVKGDVDGSVEALSDSLLKLSTEHVQVNVIHKSVGQVTDTDVLLASASDAIIVAFQVRPSPSSRRLAEKEQIDIRTYSIIYTAINEIKDAIAGMHSPEIREKILCNIEIREIFKITKVGNVAGCFVLDGKIQRNTKVRLIRDGIVIYTGKLGSLRRFKDDVKEVVAGQDCGLNIENFNDIKVGDIIEGYEEYEVKVSL
ncbi:MAG: translation initiation factor IF-2 [Bacteroidales bacterium]|nr:translation initiation factor IF-2 [Bacteroidales bacterium]